MKCPSPTAEDPILTARIFKSSRSRFFFFPSDITAGYSLTTSSMFQRRLEVVTQDCFLRPGFLIPRRYLPPQTCCTREFGEICPLAFGINFMVLTLKFLCEGLFWKYRPFVDIYSPLQRNE